MTVKDQVLFTTEEITIDQPAEQKLLTNLELEVKLKHFGRESKQASCELEKTNALLGEQMDENRQRMREYKN